MTHPMRTKDAARGKWRGILLELGVPESALTGRHGPCPICGGKDRFRWDNKEGNGTYFCSQCGPGDGIDLAMKITGRPFKEVAARVDAMLGFVPKERIHAPEDLDRSRSTLRQLIAETQPVQQTGLAHRYFESRGIDELIYPEDLRFARRLNDGNGGCHPAMVAIVRNPEGQPVTAQKTFLKRNGSGKAEIAQPRKFLAGKIPDGSCVRLCEYVPGGPLGIAEGVETAMSASALYNMPVWAALTADLLEKWSPPIGCSEIAIFGDNDASYTGQKATYSLARRLMAQSEHFRVSIHIPDSPGQDWKDVYLNGRPGVRK